ncbi:MAG: hypothetical protein PHX21_05210 [bacterium]|nr:hypothetical protein [bacterium]
MFCAIRHSRESGNPLFLLFFDTPSLWGVGCSLPRIFAKGSRKEEKK